MRFTQAYVSPDLPFFESMFREKYDLAPYHDPYQPSLFYGCYRGDDVEKLRAHQSLGVVIWGGTDITLPYVWQVLKPLKRTRLNPLCFVAGSSYIAADMKYKEIPFLRRNVVPIQTEDFFQPKPLGTKVYVYLGAPHREHIYGAQLLPEIQERLPHVEFICHYSEPETLPHLIMAQVYEECGIGLRLVEHDGCSCTVVEMGLMGRKCVWNADFPNAIPWKTVEDVVEAIEAELAQAGSVNRELAESVRQAVTQDDWLYTESYQDAQYVYEFESKNVN